MTMTRLHRPMLGKKLDGSYRFATIGVLIIFTRGKNP